MAPHQFPDLICRCGRGKCIKLQSHSENNHDRWYYKCPQNSFMNCRYFKWCNEVGPHELTNNHIISFPECRCGAGVCSLSDQDGLRCFRCPVPKGQGACRFFQWLDTPIGATANGFEAESNHMNSPRSNLKNCGDGDLAQDGVFSCKLLKTMELESSMVDSVIHSSNVRGTSAPLRTNQVSLLDNKNHSENLASPADNNQLEDRSFCSTTGDLVFPHVKSCNSKSLRKCQSDIHLRQIKFWTQISTAEAPPCNDSPSTSKSEKSDILPPQSSLEGARLSDGVLWNVPASGSPPNVEVTKPIQEVFESAAVLVQNKFLTRLESMDPSDHETMLKEANTVFTTLNHLQVNCFRFRERVMEFIDMASSLARIELSINSDNSTQELTECCLREELRLKDISLAHADVMGSLSSSEERVQMLREEASRVKNMLYQIEQQVSSCEVEILDLEIRLAELSERMLGSQKILKAASKEAEEIEKLHVQRETERRAAKEAFEKTKIQLRRC